ncbi:P-loop ATPase, Sll1717 family [Planotetraspora mira]|uniref:DNA repair ATPase n=1 Tax=Planotetraspora mira TaxID=58121 RepID=A0A8J3TW03_9ACTN|nr:hypothetical protein [Planotetraspora mira]GII34163.1 hypothetical protein Pmi06nite_76050 [Planotetraspora mira]
MTTKSRRIRSNFNLGGEQAEADPLLELAFYETGDYSAITSKLDPRCFLIGRTGSGKSAALQHLEEEYPGKVIRITPEDLSLPYIVDLQVMRYLDSLDVNLDLLFIALWKHVLLVELIRHRYKVDSPAAKQNFLSNLREKIKRDSGKRAALEYLDEFGEKFWCEADERVREITQKFEQRIDAAAKAHIGVSKSSLEANAGTGTTVANESRGEQADRFQRIVNDTQLPRLNKMLNVLDEDILDSPQHQTYVVIDDLDRDWVDERIANDLIRCLFRTVLDLKRVRHLKVLVALRTNIFRELDFGRRTGGQEEKFRSLVLQMRWNSQDLEEMLDERARIAGKNAGLPISQVRDLLPTPNKTRGNALHYIFCRTLMRPRDSISFFNECFALTSGKEKLSWNDVHLAERAYSEKRLLALRDEWKPTYPDIQKALSVFKQVDLPLDKTRLAELLDEVMILLADRDFEGVRWLTALSEAMLGTSEASNWTDLYQPLIKLFYDIGFIGLAKGPGEAVTFSHDVPGLADSAQSINEAKAFYIHPAYHYALSIKKHDQLEWNVPTKPR